MKIGVLGFGTVAQATVSVLYKNMEEIARRCGEPLELLAVATRTPSKTLGLLPAGCSVSSVIGDVVNHPDIDVVIELMGGVDDARKAVLTALSNGKHVVTANKALLAMYGNEIFQKAQEHNCVVAYEAAVAVAIPIIKILRESMAANHIESVVGIVNGTSNFILSKMREDGVAYETALAEAQELGFAEADPSFDVNGNDAAHKITIMTSLAFGVPLNLDAVRMTGISKLKIEDIQFVENMGYRLKLLASARNTAQGLVVSVEPTLVPLDHMLASVNGAMNGIYVVGDACGPNFYYGAGAGGVPTASAVLADLVDVARFHKHGNTPAVPQAAFLPESFSSATYAAESDIVAPRYLRFSVNDTIGILATISSALAKAGISVDLIRQDNPKKGKTNVLVVTHAVALGVLNEVLATLRTNDGIQADVVSLAVLA